jgi:hypothetical protein
VIPTVIGIDGGWPDVVSAEHALTAVVDALGPDAVQLACTHLTRIGGARVVLSLDLLHTATLERLPDAYTPVAAPTGDDPTSAAAVAAVAHREHRSGRAVRYPGQERLNGVLTAAEIVERSAIERVVAVLAPPVEAAAAVDTRGFVRPEWLDGLLTLRVATAPGGRLAPFEVPNPTPCCADHNRP